MSSGRSARVGPDPWAMDDCVDDLDDIENLLSDIEATRDDQSTRIRNAGGEDVSETAPGDSAHKGNKPQPRKKHLNASQGRHSSTPISHRALSNVLSADDDISPLEIVYAQEEPSLKKGLWSHDPAPAERFATQKAPGDRTNPTSPASSTPKRNSNSGRSTCNNSMGKPAMAVIQAVGGVDEHSSGTRGVDVARRVVSDPNDVKTTPLDAVTAEEHMLDIPTLEAGDSANAVGQSAVEEKGREVAERPAGSWYTRWRTEETAGVEKKAKQAVSNVRSRVNEKVEGQKRTVVGGLVHNVVGNVNPLSSKHSVGVFEAAQAYVTEEGYGAEKYTLVQASFASEDQKKTDLDTLVLFAAAHDKSFGDNLKKEEVVKVLVRRKAWKWRPVTMTGVLFTQLLLSLATLSTYSNPLNIPLTSLLFLFVVAAASSNKYRNMILMIEKLKRNRDGCIKNYGSLVFVVLVVIFLPVWSTLLVSTVLFDLLVGSVKDYSYGGMMKLLVTSVVTCTALSIGMRASSPLDAVQTFAGFAFISQMDEAVLSKMSFDPYTDYFPVKDKEAASRRVYIHGLLSIVVPLYAIVLVIITVSEYYCLICVVRGMITDLHYL